MLDAVAILAGTCTPRDYRIFGIHHCLTPFSPRRDNGPILFRRAKKDHSTALANAAFRFFRSQYQAIQMQASYRR